MNDNEELNDFELVKFLTESAFKEGSLFWRRNSVILASNLALLGASFAWLTKPGSSVNLFSRSVMCAVGLLLCGIWYLLTVRGQKMNHVWVAEAQLAARKTGNPQLIRALGQTPVNSVEKQSKKDISATGLMKLMAIGFAICWILVSMFVGL